MVALACLFLAAKVEERAVKVKDLVHVYFDIYHQKPPTDRVSVNTRIMRLGLTNEFVLNVRFKRWA